MCLRLERGKNKIQSHLQLTRRGNYPGIEAYETDESDTRERNHKLSISNTIYIRMESFPFIHPFSSAYLIQAERLGTRQTGCQSISGLMQTDRQTSNLTFAPMANLKSPINLTCMCLAVGGSWNTQTHAATQKDPSQPVDLNQGPSCCEITALITAPLCCLTKNMCIPTVFE